MKYTKKQKEKWFTGVNRILQELKAKYTGVTVYSLDTIAGELRLHIDYDVSCGVLSVFAKFEDVEKAKQVVDCNPYSGKWNYHTSATVEVALMEFEERIQSIQIKSNMHPVFAEALKPFGIK